MKVRQLHKDENGAMNGKGLMGDSSTDPLAINVHTVSSDEVILQDIFSHSLLLFNLKRKKSIQQHSNFRSFCN